MDKIVISNHFLIFNITIYFHFKAESKVYHCCIANSPTRTFINFSSCLLFFFHIKSWFYLINVLFPNFPAKWSFYLQEIFLSIFHFLPCHKMSLITMLHVYIAFIFNQKKGKKFPSIFHFFLQIIPLKVSFLLIFHLYMTSIFIGSNFTWLSFLKIPSLQSFLFFTKQSSL